MTVIYTSTFPSTLTPKIATEKSRDKFIFSEKCDLSLTHRQLKMR